MGATVSWRSQFCLLTRKRLFKFPSHFQSVTASTRMIIRNENEDASSKRMLTLFENDSPAPWSDLNHDLLFLVMMKLGAVDFSAFSGVCKSWRSLALSNWKKFVASRQPRTISISTNANGEDHYFHLRFDETSFKTILPHSANRKFVGYSCGYMVLFGRKTRDFWLVNPIIRHELHFPANLLLKSDDPRIRAFLVFSPSTARWVFVMTDGSKNIWFSVEDQGAWNHVSSAFPVVDLHVFKGKMYVINTAGHLCELRLYQQPKLVLLEMKNILIFPKSQLFLSSHDHFYVMRYLSEGCYELHRLDFDNMKWVVCVRKETLTSSHGKGKRVFGDHYHVCLNE